MCLSPYLILPNCSFSHKYFVLSIESYFSTQTVYFNFTVFSISFLITILTFPFVPFDSEAWVKRDPLSNIGNVVQSFCRVSALFPRRIKVGWKAYRSPGHAPAVASTPSHNFFCNLIILHSQSVWTSHQKQGLFGIPALRISRIFSFQTKLTAKCVDFLCFVKMLHFNFDFFFLLVSTLLCLSFVKLAFSNVKSLLPTEWAMACGLIAL